MFAEDNRYLARARLAAQALRHVAAEPELALKGGTAINFFFRNLLRLSVDLDLVFIPVLPRAETLAEIEAALRRIALSTERSLKGARVNTSQAAKGKLLVTRDGADVVIEVNLVLRGCVRSPARRTAQRAVEALFGDIDANVLSFEDCFAGKLVAALDRQHPRDLFDVAQLLDAEGLSEPLLDAFVVYLASHGRPMSELLAPGEKDIGGEFENDFGEMAAERVSLDTLRSARSRFVRELHRTLLPRHKEFLRSIKALEPDWSLVPVPHAADLPGVRWRLLNLEKFRREQPQRYAAARAKLDRVLDAMN